MWGPYRLEDDLLKLDFDCRPEMVSIPTELYLRELADLDLGKSQKILDFVNTYGRLGHPEQAFRRSDEPLLNRNIIRLLGVEAPDSRQLPWEDWWAEIDDLLKAHAEQQRLDDETRMMLELYGLQHIDDFRAWAHAFRVMTDTYTQFIESDRKKDNGLLETAIVLEQLLEVYGPKLKPMPEDREDTAWSIFEDTRPRLENILALQLFNHIAADAAFKTCANENCQRLFVHQRGRSEHGHQKKTGIKYCSDTCARAQASRDYRSRKREMEA